MQTTINPVLVSGLRQSFINNREKSLEKIYAKAYPMVLYYVKKHQGTPDDAQDLLQDAIIIMYEKVVHGQLTLTASVTTYIMSICKNLWKQELEKRHRRNQKLMEGANLALEEMETKTELPKLQLLHFVQQLGEKCRDILVAFYYFNRSMAAIAEEHDYRNVHTATVQKFKCLERLRKSVATVSIDQFK